MAHPASRAVSRLLLLSLALLLVFGDLAWPDVAIADTSLSSGDSAVVSNTGGDRIRVRSSAGTSGSIVDYLYAGDSVEIVSGPTQANGLWWYQVTGDADGYVAADYLEADDGGSSGGSTATVTSSLNLRSGAGTSYSVKLVMPAGATVTVTGSGSNGFLPVTYQGTSGWASAQYLDAGDDGGVDDGGDVIGSGATTSSLNLRSGPGTSYSVILVMPSGATVDLYDSTSNGFQKVGYQGTVGWASTTYLDTDGGDDGGGDVIDTATTTSSLNLRSGAGTTYAVLLVMPAGAEVGITGSAQNGFYPVRYSGTDGWASGTYLRIGDDGGSVGGSIIWPVSGGQWEIIQGYNGGTHQNRSASAQYFYSMDIARTDGNTAYEEVYAPASGTVVWNDPNSGGILIDMGNGYGVAMFHCTIDSSWLRGDSVERGDLLGYVSPPGGNGYQVVDHVDITLWRIPNGGSSPRYAAPFSGDSAISGNDFYDTGGSNQWGGTVFYP